MSVLYLRCYFFFPVKLFVLNRGKTEQNRKSQITQKPSVTRQSNFTAHFFNTLISVTSLFAEGKNFFMRFFNFLLFSVMCNTSRNRTNDMLQLVNCSTVTLVLLLLCFLCLNLFFFRCTFFLVTIVIVNKVQ